MSTTKPSPRNDRAFISMMNAIKGANSSQGDKAEAGDIAAMLGSIKKLTLKPHQSQKLAHNEGMDTKNHPSHRELDAKLETIEARMDGRLARIEDRFNSIDKHLESIGHQFLEVRATFEEQKNTAWKAAAATIGIMIATIIAVAALGFSAFDSGRDTEKIASEAKAEISSSVAEVRQMVQELKQQQEEIKP